MRLSFHSMRLAMNASKQRRSNLINEELSAHYFNLQFAFATLQHLQLWVKNSRQIAKIDSL